MVSVDKTRGCFSVRCWRCGVLPCSCWIHKRPSTYSWHNPRWMIDPNEWSRIVQRDLENLVIQHQQYLAYLKELYSQRSSLLLQPLYRPFLLSLIEYLSTISISNLSRSCKALNDLCRDVLQIKKPPPRFEEFDSYYLWL